MREPSRTRWLCTAAVASRSGIGAARRVGAAVGEHQDRRAVVRTSREACGRARRAPARGRAARRRSRRTGTRACRRGSGRGGSARSFSRSRGSSTGCGHRDAPGVLGRLVEQVALRADRRAQAHHERLALRVDRRVRDLREVLLEVGGSSCGRSDSAASGVSTPIEPTGSWPVGRHRRDQQARSSRCSRRARCSRSSSGGSGCDGSRSGRSSR